MHSRSRKSHPVRSIQRPHRSVPAPIRTHLSIPSTSDNGQVEGAQKVRSYPSVSAADGIHHYDKTQLMPASPPASSSASPLLPSFSLPPALQPTATSKGALLHSTVREPVQSLLTAGPSIGKLVRPARRCVTARPLSIPYTAEPTSMAAGAIYTPLLLPMRKSSSSNSNNSGGSVSVSASSVGSDVQSWKQLRLRRLLSYTYEAPNHHCVSQCQGGYATSQGCNSSQQCSLCTSGNNGNDQGQTVPSMPIQDSGLPWISNTRGYDNTVNGRSAGIAGKRLRDSGSVDGYTYLSESDDTLAGSDVAKDGGSGRGVIIESNRGCILKRARRGGRRSVISKDPIQWSKSAPLDIPSTAIGFHLLSTDEVQTCSVLRLQPETYLRIKDIMLTARAQRGVFKKREAQRWCRIDVNKTARIYDWFVRLGWLDHPEY
ncbi:hypothetical protein BASA60_000877 [Batrachochytrium salamandrivorans]|nr:hypothetical protein BASA60_000877 [Batrachochytrium salamandrivorans]